MTLKMTCITVFYIYIYIYNRSLASQPLYDFLQLVLSQINETPCHVFTATLDQGRLTHRQTQSTHTHTCYN